MMTASASDKQVDDLRESAVHDSFIMMEQMQVQVERITRNLMALEPDQPHDIQHLLNEWRVLLQRETRQFRERIEESFHYARSFLTGPDDKSAGNPENDSQDGGK
jgi:hypothetical protein